MEETPARRLALLPETISQSEMVTVSFNTPQFERQLRCFDVQDMRVVHISDFFDFLFEAFPSSRNLVHSRSSARSRFARLFPQRTCNYIRDVDGGGSVLKGAFYPLESAAYFINTFNLPGNERLVYRQLVALSFQNSQCPGLLTLDTPMWGPILLSGLHLVLPISRVGEAIHP